MAKPGGASNNATTREERQFGGISRKQQQQQDEKKKLRWGFGKVEEARKLNFPHPLTAAAAA